MSMVDFKQEARDQACLHIALKALGPSKVFCCAVAKFLHSLPPIQLTEAKGTVIFLRFLDGDDLPCWAGSSGGVRWDEFSAHKSVLGLLCIAVCHHADDFADIKAGYKEICKTHSRWPCASKCIVYGSMKNLESCIKSVDGFVHINYTADEKNTILDDIQPQKVEAIINELVYSILRSLKSKMDMCMRLIGGTDSLPHLKAPMETKETSEEDSEQRQSRNLLLGRLYKQIADLYLLTGQLQKAGECYRNASEQLKSQKDWLWVGGAHEGLCVTAMMTKECEQVLGQKAQGVEAPTGLARFGRTKHSNLRSNPRAHGFSTGGSVTSNRHTISNDSRKNKDLPRSPRSAATRHSAAKSPSPPDSLEQQLDEREGISSGLVISNRQQDSSLSNDLDEEVDGVMEDFKKEEEETLSFLIDSRLLHKDFIVDKFTLALVYFRKAGKVGTISHMESLLKFSKYLVNQKHWVKAADMLQRMSRIDGINDKDKLSLYRTMASIYQSMGFHRKAAMFTLLAAQFAGQKQLTTDAHSLLVASLPGYKLSRELDTLQSTTASYIGWPNLQASVLKEFITLSHELGEDLIVIRRSCFLLEALHQNMTAFDLKLVTKTLEKVATRARNSEAKSSDMNITSPIPLKHFPFVRSFYPRPLISNMAPLKRKGSKSLANKDVVGVAADNPFIYSPFLGPKKTVKRNEVLWVEDDPAEIALSIVNPLPFELRVENMALLMEGVKVEIFPSSLTLPRGTEQSQFALVIIPHEVGLVTVLGYEGTVFGVYHKCYMKIAGDPIIRVIPRLPLLKVRVFPVLGTGGSGVCEDMYVGGRRLSKACQDKFDLMDGESCQCELELESINDIDISYVNISIKKYNNEFCHFSWDAGPLNSSLPLISNRKYSLCVSVKASIPYYYRLISDFTNTVLRQPHFSEAEEVKTIPQGTAQELSQTTDSNVAAGSSTTSSLKRGQRTFQTLLGHRRKPSNEGLERGGSKQTRSGSSLMESLNLDHPLMDSRHSNTVPNMVRSSPARSSYKGTRFKKNDSSKGSGQQKKSNHVNSMLDYDDVILGLDKRASVRSDPGERDQGDRGKSKLKISRVGVSYHTSPTSSSTAIASDSMRPVNIFGSIESDGTSSDSSAKTQSLKRNISFQASNPKVRPNINKGNISLPTGPLYKAVPQPPKRVKVVGEFVFDYSGGKSASEGYYREGGANVSVFVRPCLLFDLFDMKSSNESQDLFQLCFVMHNVSTLPLSVTCKVDQAGLMEAGGTAQLTENLEANTNKKLNLLIRKFKLDSDDSNSPGTKTEIHLTKQYSKKLAEMLSFHWEVVGGADRKGTVTLEGLRLPVSITAMRPHPILFNVMLNQEECSPVETTHSKKLGVGTIVRAFIKLTNNSSTSMLPSFLVLEPYSFSQELKKIIRNLSGRMLYSGSLVTSVPKLPPGVSFQHEICISFLYKGDYLLNIKSVIPTTPTQRLEVMEGMIAKSPVKRAKEQRPSPIQLPSQPSESQLHSPPFSPVSSVSTSSSVSSPPSVIPKSAKAIARRYEAEFATKKMSHTTHSPVIPTDSDNTFNGSDSLATTNRSIETPPPVPTSSRPPLNKSTSVDVEKKLSSVEPLKNRSYTVHRDVVTTAKSIPLHSKIKHASKISFTPVSTKVRSELLLPCSQSNCTNLLHDHTQNPGSIRVTHGPNLSFHVS